MKRKQKIISAALVFVLLGSVLASLSLFAKDNDAVAPIESLAVVDAAGKKVGNILGFTQFGSWGGNATVATRIGGEVVILYVSPTGFIGGGSLTKNLGVSFESSNCTGAPSMSAPQPLGNPALVPYHVLNGTKLYSFVGIGATNTMVIGSFEFFDGLKYVCQTYEHAVQAPAQPLRFLIDLSTQFKPPFSLRADPGPQANSGDR